MRLGHVAFTSFRASSHAPMHRHVLKSRTPTFSSLLSREVQPQPQPCRPRQKYKVRALATSRPADTVMDTLTELYSTAKDEFEIAAEETERRTVYAPNDRQAAKEALQML